MSHEFKTNHIMANKLTTLIAQFKELKEWLTDEAFKEAQGFARHKGSLSHMCMGSASAYKRVLKKLEEFEKL